MTMEFNSYILIYFSPQCLSPCSKAEVQCGTPPSLGKKIKDFVNVTLSPRSNVLTASPPVPEEKVCHIADLPHPVINGKEPGILQCFPIMLDISVQHS